MKKIISIAFLVLTMGGFAQNTAHLVAPWKLTYYDGQVSLMGNYRNQSWLTSSNNFNFYNTSHSTAISGDIALNTSSYVWHPNFLLLNAGFAFSPGRFQDNYLETIDFFTVSTTKRINLGATVFNSKPVTFTSNFNMNETYQKRENITDIKNTNNNIGVGLMLKNNNFPLQINYDDIKTEQIELDVERSIKDRRRELKANVKRSFFDFDKHHLSYLHEDRNYEYFSRNQDYMNSFQTISSNNLSLSNNFNFNYPLPSSLSSSVDYYDRKGFLPLKKLQVIENIRVELPYHLENKSVYQYSDFTQSGQNIKTHTARTGLSHQLYLSLKSGLNYQYANIKQSNRNETNHIPGLSLNYVKKIPTKGILTMDYHYSKKITNVTSESRTILIFNEEHTLSNSEIKLLDKPFADINTVLVKDITGTIIYQLNFDYTLLQTGNYIEIRRIPGGLIADGGMVLIDYQAIQPGNYNYQMDQHRFLIKISLFERMVNLYYNRNQQGYAQVDLAEFLILNVYTENIIGTSIEKHFGKAGVEYTDYQSSIFPFTMKRYYANIHHQFLKKTLLSINGSFSDYTYLDPNRKQKNIDLSGKITYNFKAQSNLNLDISLRNVYGDIQQLNMITSRLEYTGVFYNLYVTAGVEAYKRNYLQQEVKLNGIYFRLVRKFSK